MTRNLNSKMITVAREVRGLTQIQLSKLVPRLSQGCLSKIEMGLIGASEEVVSQIANILSFPEIFFYDEYTFTPFSNVYYRKSISAPIKKMTQLDAVFKTTMMAVDNMLYSIDIPEFAIPEIDVDVYDDPELVARETRFKLGVPDGHITDLIKILEKNGVIVIEVDSDVDKFSGMSVRTHNGTMIIFINGNMPNDRKNFTIAHELGHIVMHIPFSPSMTRDIEKDANSFASEFLMPYKDFRRMVTPSLSYFQLDALKLYWRTSKQSIIYKAHKSRIINDSKNKSLMVQLSMNGERKLERTPIEYNKPQLLNRIFEAFYNDLDYTKDELIEAIKVPIDTLPLSMNRSAKIIRLSPTPRIQL